MIPFLYTFSYRDNALKPAIGRLLKSIKSLDNSGSKIYIAYAIDEADEGIKDIKGDLIHSIFAIQKTFNKSKLINYVIKHYLQGFEYCIISDCDILWPLGTVGRFLEHTKRAPNTTMVPSRVIP